MGAREGGAVSSATQDAQAVTFLHSCKCGGPIDCTGDEINMLGTLVCSHFHCEPCTIAYYIENSKNAPRVVDIRTGKTLRRSEERIRESVRSQYRTPLDCKLEPARRMTLTKDEHLLDVAYVTDSGDRRSWPYFKGPVETRRNE